MSKVSIYQYESPDEKMSYIEDKYYSRIKFNDGRQEYLFNEKNSR